MEKLDCSAVRWEALFPDPNPVEIEIGCGKGRYLAERAAENPRINFIAFDRLWRYVKFGHNRAERRRLQNIKFFKTEAAEFLTRVVPDESVRVFHIYFPDPWPKKRQQKRRLLNSSFLRLLARKTTPRGSVRISTDHEGYYAFIKEALAENEAEWALNRESVNKKFFAGNIKTNYEVKYEREGRRIFYLELRRCAAPPPKNRTSPESALHLR